MTRILPLIFIGLTIWLLMGLTIGLLAGAWEPFIASVILFTYAALFFAAACLYERWSG